MSLNLIALVPEKYQPLAKAIIGALGLVLTAVAALVPADTRVGVVLAAVVAVLGTLGIYQTPNVKEAPAADVTSAMAEGPQGPSGVTTSS